MITRAKLKIYCSRCKEDWSFGHKCKRFWNCPTVDQITEILTTMGVDETNHAYREIATYAWTRAKNDV